MLHLDQLLAVCKASQCVLGHLYSKLHGIMSGMSRENSVSLYSPVWLEMQDLSKNDCTNYIILTAQQLVLR